MGVPAGSTGLVSLDDVKNALNMTGTTAHDAELQTFIDGIAPVVEFYTGPVVAQAVTEWHDGGSSSLMLRKRPVISITSVTEYLGGSPYPLTAVASPDLGSLYSYQWEPSGYLVRRGAGGGLVLFPPGPQAVQIVYTAGRTVTPPNIRIGTLELIRVNYQQTQQGRPSRSAGGSDDTVAGATVLGYFVPNRVKEMLTPSRRAPRVA